MGRVEQGGRGAGGGRPPSVVSAVQRHHKQLTNSAKPSYKVILEEVTQTRKALRLQDYPSIDPPRDYKFVPAGDPTLTTKCKELARLDGKLVYAVSTAYSSVNELSREVHRVGFHFPAEIVQRALTSLGINLDQEDKILRKHDLWPVDEQRRQKKPRNMKNAKSFQKNGNGRLPNDLNLLQMSQEEVDAQAKAAILDMFPAMPQENLYQIILHSFELGTDRVGVQLNDLSLPRRVQLAVVAHIRHVYTDYDNLLHTAGWSGARAQVASRTLEVLASWRGDKDDEIDVVEDILREVIVISDDEGESEPIASLPVQNPRQAFEWGSQFTNMPGTNSQPRPFHRSSGRVDKRGSRREIWLNARERRKGPIPLPQARVDHSYYIPRPGHAAPLHVDQRLYEQRLRELENSPRQRLLGNRLTYVSASSTLPYNRQEQMSLHQMHRQPSKPEAYRHPMERLQSKQDYQATYHLPEDSLGSNNRVNHDHKRVSHGKLELLPVSEDVLPSIETPRAERGAPPVSTRGAIYVDSPPPPDLRIDYQRTRVGREKASPAQRKRAASPQDLIKEDHKQVIYLPIRETQTWYEQDTSDHRNFARQQERDQEPVNRVVYLPLDDNNNVQPHRRLESAYVASKGNEMMQIYLDGPSRANRQLEEDEHSGLRYRYIPLESAQNHGGAEAAPYRASDRTATRLIPIGGFTDTINSPRGSGTGRFPTSTGPLDSSSTYQQGSPNGRQSGSKPLRQPANNMFMQHIAENRDHSNRPALYSPDSSSTQIRAEGSRHKLNDPGYASIPYDPYDPQAGLSAASSNQQRNSWR